MQTVMGQGHTFSRVPAVSIPRSSFDRSHGVKTTFDAGYLIPVLVDEVLPGDTYSVNMAAFCRLATPIKPIMDNMYCDSFFFFVPNRLLWDNWEKFNGAQTNPGDSTSYLVPTMTGPGGAGITIGSLSDYFGIPTGIASISFISLYHRAYNLIYNTWFRDENLQNSVVVDVDDGPDTYTDYVLLRRGKRHDYFTSCLPWPQKGTAVTLPLGTSATVKTIASDLVTGVQAGIRFRMAADAPINTNLTASFNSSQLMQVGNPASTAWNGPIYPQNLYADLSTATAATINALRQANQLQVLYERDARGGTRYTEILLSHFGVQSPDARLQRPEYLGGGSSAVNIHPVAQTAVSGATPQGNLAAFGTTSLQGHGFTKSFVEHGVIIGLVSVRADLTYQQGLDRMWSRSTRWDYYWPALSQIGEQAVLNKEIWMDGTANDLLTFGYQERHAEYRYKPSKITGLFRSNAAGTLEVWHLSQDFAALPALNASFIVDDPPIDRCIAVPTEPHFIGDFFFKMKCARPMPLFGVPSSMGRF